MRRVGVVGAGWAGLAAAVELAEAGWQVQMWEMATSPGGRGRSGIAQTLPQHRPWELDAGQHILIGAYTESLRLIQRLGVDPKQAFWRAPLALVGPDGLGLTLPAGHPMVAFLRGLSQHRAWPWRTRLQLLWRVAGWHRRGFRCAPGLTVAQLCAGLAPQVMHELMEPLCVAALNTPAASADAQVFLRVLADGLFAGPGGSDLLLPRWPLRRLLPSPALDRLQALGAGVHLGERVTHIEPLGQGRWRVQAKASQTVDRLVVATSPVEAGRLLQPWDAAWAATARGLQFEPIVTCWVEAPGVRLPHAMVRLDHGPAQFVFDLAAMGVPWDGGLSLVVSDAGPLLDHGLAALEQAVLKQAQALPGAQAHHTRVVRSIAERRATFACTPGLLRPPGRAAAAHGGLWVAGDYVEGPYPSTLEGAVRSGVAAAQQLRDTLRDS
ncbi:MAG: hydroxysqualene dehydroxylase HpnE [Betaproteobacteria bacterium]